MANVSTWEEFVTVYTSDSDNTITLTQDITCPETGIESTIAAGQPNTVIEGNSHTIWNISGSAARFFVPYGYNQNSYVTWKNINFNNIYTSLGTVFSSGGYGQSFIDCTFQGQGGKLCNNGTFTRCAVTWKNTTATNGTFYGCSMNYCWVHVDVRRSTDNTNPEFESLNTTYLEGSIGGTSITNPGTVATTMTNSCINITTDLTYSDLTPNDPVQICVANVTLCPNYTGSRANIVKVTDAQMKDASYLASVGFAIIDI